tara:strand:+ start:210 stop:662 length:453 start_codon:yes stop_codon:yes gene_type:complete
MFNKKKIIENQESIKSLKSRIDKIEKLLDSKEFEKDWKEFHKYKKIKNKLPNIEEMYKLKTLKNLINKREKWSLQILSLQDQYYNHKSTYGDIHTYTRAAKAKLELKHFEYENMEKQINEIISFLKSNKNDKDLIEIFKLYAISMEWLHP